MQFDKMAVIDFKDDLVTSSIGFLRRHHFRTKVESKMRTRRVLIFKLSKLVTKEVNCKIGVHFNSNSNDSNSEN